MSDYYDSKLIESKHCLLNDSYFCFVRCLVFKTHRGPQKVLSTTVFLYFACLLPSIAFGVLNSQATDDQISVPKAVASQCLGGLFFSLFAGQPLIVVMTTAPLTLYVKGENNR
jgi:hypothetical protein